jgi:hypothetical protein
MEQYLSQSIVNLVIEREPTAWRHQDGYFINPNPTL